MILRSSSVALLFMCYLLLFVITNANAQVNYVLNPSLENYTKCPYDFDQIKFAKYWTSIDTGWIPNAIDSFGNPNCTPEYCNSCAGLNYAASIPINDFFYHYPRTGNGLAQVMMFSDETFYYPYLRDYLQGHLYKALTTGKSYCVTFFVCLENTSQYAVNHIGAYLDNGEIDTTQNCGLPQTEYTSTLQVLETTIINDTLNWTKVEGSFTAMGNEKFITVGNFFSKSNTSYISTGFSSNYHAIYLVDDISVVESDHVAFAGNDTTIALGDSAFLGEIAVPYTWYKNSSGLSLIDSTSGGIWVKPALGTTDYMVKQTLCGVSTWDSVKITVVPVDVKNVGNVKNVSVYPNPNNGNFTIAGTTNNTDATIEILNTVGQVVYKKVASIQHDHLQEQINLNMPAGVYVLKITNDAGTSYFQRLVIYK